MHLTPYLAVNSLVADCVSAISATLGEKLIGLYVYNSMVVGDFDLAASDVDLLAVTSTALDDEDLSRLRQMHDDLVRGRPEWRERIEVAYVPLAALETFRSQRSAIIVISPGEPLHFKDAGIDWLANWYVVREQGVALFGPLPSEIIGPISREEFVRAIEDYARAWAVRIESWGPHRGSQAYAILTLCRALYTHTHGQQVSKLRAAQWAMARLPEWCHLIQRALAWRAASWLKPVDDPAALPATVQFVKTMIDLITE